MYSIRNIITFILALIQRKAKVSQTKMLIKLYKSII